MGPFTLLVDSTSRNWISGWYLPSQLIFHPPIDPPIYHGKSTRYNYTVAQHYHDYDLGGDLNNLWKESLHAKSMDCERPKAEDFKVDPNDYAEPVLKDETIIFISMARHVISLGLSNASD